VHPGGVVGFGRRNSFALPVTVELQTVHTTRAYTGACPHYTVNTGRLEAPKATAREHGYSVHTDRKLLSLFSFTVRHCSVICGRSSASGRLKFFRTLPDEPHPIYTESIPETADMQLRGRWTKTDGGRGSFV